MTERSMEGLITVDKYTFKWSRQDKAAVLFKVRCKTKHSKYPLPIYIWIGSR